MFDSEFVSKVLEAFIMATIPVLIPVLVSVAIAYWKKVKAEIEPNVYSALYSAATIAVRAAEQLAMSGVIQEKKQYAIDQVTLMMKERGINIDFQTISAMIESVVLEEFNLHKLEDNKKSIGFSL